MSLSIVSQRALLGPNIWADRPVGHAIIDAGSLQLSPDEIGQLAGFLTDRLTALEDQQSTEVPVPPTGVGHLRDLPDLVGWLAVNLQRRTGEVVVFHAGRQVPGTTHFESVYSQAYPPAGAEACRIAVRWLNSLLKAPIPRFDLEREFCSRLSLQAGSVRPGAVGQRIMEVARERGIPVSRLDPMGRMVELGSGAYRRRFHGSITSFTSKLAEGIAYDKSLTNHYLRSAGLPVPDGRVARKEEQAVRIARELGYPLVVKPVDHGASVGVTVNIQRDDDLLAAFTAALPFSKTNRVLIERYITGQEYRVMVVDGRVHSVSLHTPAAVIGDGIHTVSELIEIGQADPRRGTRDVFPLKPILIDDVTIREIERQGHAMASVPTAGERVQLRPTAKIAHGGFTFDCTERTHPDNLDIFVQAVRAIGADVASIDVVATDISTSIWETGGAILELNLGSSFRNDLYPGEGIGRDAAPPILDMLFPAGQSVRAPLIAVCGEGAHEVGRALVDAIAAAGARVGFASREGIEIGGRLVRHGDARGPAGTGVLLDNPSTEFVVVEVDPKRLAAEWFGASYCEAAVLLSLSGLTRPSGAPVEEILVRLCQQTGGTVLAHSSVMGLIPEGLVTVQLDQIVAHGGVEAFAAFVLRAIDR